MIEKNCNKCGRACRIKEHRQMVLACRFKSRRDKTEVFVFDGSAAESCDFWLQRSGKFKMPYLTRKELFARSGKTLDNFLPESKDYRPKSGVPVLGKYVYKEGRL